MRVEIIAIGEEILSGAIVDTNSSLISRRLREVGDDVAYHTTMGDRRDDILDAFKRAATRVEAVIVTGGLGPTVDDITTVCAAEAAGVELHRDAQIEKNLRAMFQMAKIQFSENNLKQADFPVGAEVLPNPRGTAPGFAVTIDGVPFYCAPGVPRELTVMLEQQILPRMAKLRGGEAVAARTFKTFGMTEAKLDKTLADVMPATVETQFRAAFPEIHVTLVARGKDAAETATILDDAERILKKAVGDIIFAEGAGTMESIVGDLLTDKGMTVSTAESCTGGLVAKRLTDVPGSSAYFTHGYVTYANIAKEKDLGVPHALLEEYGAVSAPVARAMAAGARARSGASVAVSLTGVAGPGGGTQDKPVGTLFVGLAHADGAEVHPYQRRWGDREQVRAVFAQMALDILRRHLLAS